MLGRVQGITYGEDVRLLEGHELESEARTVVRLNTWIGFALSDLHLSNCYLVSDGVSQFTVVSVFHFLYNTFFLSMDYEEGTKEWSFKDFVN